MGIIAAIMEKVSGCEREEETKKESCYLDGWDGYGGNDCRRGGG